MTFTQAVSSVLGQYAGFRGRARRSEFWWWTLFTLLLGLAVGLAEASLGIADEDGGPVSTLVGLSLLVPNVAVIVRRLHDTSRTGWWLLIALVPFVGIAVLLWFVIADSSPGANQHGFNPKAALDGYDLGAGPLAGYPTDQVPGPEAGEAPAAAATPDDGWVPPGWDLPGPDEPTQRRPETSTDQDRDTRPDRPQA